MKKLTRIFGSIVLTTAFVLGNIGPAFAANEPVSGAEVTLCTFGDTGLLEAIGAPVTTDADGNFEAELPATIPEHTPVFACAQSADGTGAPQVSYVDKKKGDATVDPATTAITNTLIGFMSTTDALDAQDLGADVVDEFFEVMEPVVEDVPVDDTAADTVSRMADAMSLNPTAFIMATRKLPVPAAETLASAANVDKLAILDGKNPFGDEAPNIDTNITAGSHTTALIDPRIFAKLIPEDFDFNEEFGDDIMPPGSLKGHIPEGSFMLPPGLKVSDKHGELPEYVVVPMGVEIDASVDLSPTAVISPGTIIGEGWAPHEDMPLPPGLIMPDYFEELFGENIEESWEAPEDFVPPPGYTLLDKEGGVGLPPTFKMKEGFEFDPEAEFHMFPAEDIPGFEDIQHKYEKLGKDFLDPLEHGFVHHFEEGFEFGEDAILNSSFNPEQFRMTPPEHFERHEFGGEPADFERLKAEGFEFLVPEGYDFNPDEFFGAAMIDGKPVPGLFDPDNLPEGAVIPDEFLPPEGHEGPWDPFAGAKGAYDDLLDSGVGPDGQPLDPNDPKLGDNFDPNAQHDGDKEHEGTFEDDGEFIDVDGDGIDDHSDLDGDGQHDEKPPEENVDYAQEGNDDYQPKDDHPDNPDPGPVYKEPVHHEEPSSGGGGEGEHQHIVQSYRTLARANDGSKRLIGTLSTGDVNDIALPAPEGTNAKKGGKVTASAGVYRIGKTTSNSDTVRMSIIVDPSLSDESVKVNLKVENEIETEIIDVDNQAVQLVTQKSGKFIEASTVNTNIEFSATKIKGYLLEPGTSTTKMQKAIPVTGKVIVGDDSSIVKFTIPEKAKTSGLHTVTFTDGDQTYFGKVTLGTVKAKTISGKVLAPGGSL